MYLLYRGASAHTVSVREVWSSSEDGAASNTERDRGREDTPTVMLLCATLCAATYCMPAASFTQPRKMHVCMGKLDDESTMDRSLLYSQLRECTEEAQVNRLINVLNPDDVSSHTVAISALGRVNDSNAALALFDSMQQKGIQPTLLAFNSALGACAKAGDWQRALVLLEQMRERSISADVISFNSVISACARAGKYKRALMILDTMRKVGQP